MFYTGCFKKERGFRRHRLNFLHNGAISDISLTYRFLSTVRYMSRVKEAVFSNDSPETVVCGIRLGQGPPGRVAGGPIG